MILIITYIVIGFAILQLLVALVNLLFPQNFDKNGLTSLPLVSILIPARNEEKNISNILNDIIKQEYQNFEVLVFNDLSTDKTARIVMELSKFDKRIKLINSEGLPEGWLGKNYACHSLAKEAHGKYFLFLDADVRIHKDIITNAINFVEKHSLGLISIFPTQLMVSLGERIAVPNMNYILLSLLPLILVRLSKRQSLAAANGQFMLFKAINYRETFPHEKMKLSKVEDIEIARYYKQKKIKIACLTGLDTSQCRMYENINDAINGFSKNVISFFGDSFILALLFWIITSLGFLIFIIGHVPKLLILYMIILITTRIVISVISKQKITDNLILFIPQQIALGFFIYKAFYNKRKKLYVWKDRNI